MLIFISPFQNLSDNDELDYLAIGFLEDLITDLSRFTALELISGNRAMERELPPGVEFVVKGSFRSGTEKLRINVQLLKADSQRVLWAERYEENLSSILAVQDEISKRIVSALQTQIDFALLSASRQKPVTSLAAYDCWLRGLHQLKKGSLDSDIRAREYFKQAIALDSEYARAYTGMSLSYFNEWSCQLWDRWEVSQWGAFDYASKAVAIDENDYLANAVLGRVYIYMSEYEKAEECIRKSILLNPNDAGNLVQTGTSLVYLGYAEEGLKLYERALLLNPFNTGSYHGCGAFANFEMGNYAECISLGLKTPFASTWVDFPAFIAAAFFHLGDNENALHYWGKYEAQHQEKISKDGKANKEEAIRWIIMANPFKLGSNLQPFLDFLGNTEIAWPAKQANTRAKYNPDNIFKRGHELWEMCFDGQLVVLPEVKGYNDLALLLSQPEKEIYCAELIGGAIEGKDNYLVFDEQAKKSYKEKLRNLSLEINEAEDFNDPVRLARLRKEYDELINFLTKSLGINGKARKLGSESERIRSAVTWRIRSAIKRIEKSHPSLANHFKKSVQTGTFCSYSPEIPITWTV